MNTRSRRLLISPTIAGACALLLLVLPVPLRAAPKGSTFNVNNTLDEPNVDASLGNCVSTPSGQCTLRAAIQAANFVAGPNLITVPSGTFALTRAGYDDEALVGDLDIKHDLTIQGAGSGATIIDGNGSVTNDRVFQIIASSNVTMTGMTIQNGKSLSSTVGVIGGGGLYMEGTGHLQLSNVIFDSNTGLNGGGIYSNLSAQGGSITMANVILHANRAIAGGVGAGGGVFAYLPSSNNGFIIQDSTIYSNTADGTGGGLYVSGNTSIQWSIQHSQIYSNTATAGGAIGNLLPLVLSDSTFHGNHASSDGGALEAFAPFAIYRSTMDSNSAGRFGGAIFDLQDSPLASYREFVHIEQSTMNGNAAQYGGGIYHDGYIVPTSTLTLLNSTVSDNIAFRPGGGTGSSDGGGIYVYGGQAQLLNATIAYNYANPGITIQSHVARGGGVFITATATLTAFNSVIGNNLRTNFIQTPIADDCFSTGTVGELAYDLIFTTTNCFVTGPQGGLVVGHDPLLGPLQNNGGPTQMRALLASSPAIDTGAPGGCTDDHGAPLTTDQRGFHRPFGAHCDIGAYERGTFFFLPLILR